MEVSGNVVEIYHKSGNNALSFVQRVGVSHVISCARAEVISRESGLLGVSLYDARWYTQLLHDRIGLHMDPQRLCCVTSIPGSLWKKPCVFRRVDSDQTAPTEPSRLD